MFTIGATFVFSVFTFYTIYGYFLQQNEFFQQLSRIHLDYQIFYAIYTYMVIYAGSIIAREVDPLSPCVLQCIKKYVKKTIVSIAIG